MSLSIGINAIAPSCVDDLNNLLHMISPTAHKLSWADWYNIMQSSSTLITCFDDENSHVIGMTTIVPNIRPTGKFVQICDTIVSQKYNTAKIEANLKHVAHTIIKKTDLELISMYTYTELDAHAIEEECLFIINETNADDKDAQGQNVVNFFSALKIGVIKDIKQLNQFVQEIEEVAGYNPDFIEKFRRCVYGLYDKSLLDYI